MTLTFSKELFVTLIEMGIKIHTIREDKVERWHAGKKIDFWLHNPRNPSKNPRKFNNSAIVNCVSIQSIIIKFDPFKQCDMEIWVDGKELSDAEIELLAKNDGLLIRQFRNWFLPKSKLQFKGKIIHWTDKKY